ncbi:CBS domain-containing protein [Rhizobiales bacterium GAS188]|nr:CBS domain-containing protein [Rhizobiales bacterium GAS188]
MSTSSNSEPDASLTPQQGEGPVRRIAGRVKRALHLGALPAPKENLNHAMTLAEGGADASSQERAMLKNVLALRQARVADVMIPRADIVAVPADVTLAELMKVFRDAAHSRLPVYGETLDEPYGMVHIRDFVDYLGSKAQEAGGERGKVGRAPVADLGRVDLATPLEELKILRPVLYVPSSMRAMALLRRMQATRTHMALVIDEYGGTDGLVSIEDLIEIVVGEIEDEHDDEEGPLVSRIDERTLVAGARAELSEVSAMLGVDLSVGHAAEEVDTIGGLIVTLAGRVPVRGELIAGPGDIEFEVMDADPRRLKRVRIHLLSNGRRMRRPKEQPADANPPAAASTVSPGPAAQEASADQSEDGSAGAANEPA